MRSPSFRQRFRQRRCRSPRDRRPAARQRVPLLALLLLPFAGAVATGAAAAPGGLPVTGTLAGAALGETAGSTASPSRAAIASWSEAPLETLGDDHQVREGHVAAPSEVAADAELAARGIVVGTSPALEELSRRAARAKASEATDRSPLYGHDDVWIADVGVLLRDDRDGDGFFGSFELSLDVDTDGYERDVYAVLELVDVYGVPSLRHDTATFTIRGNAVSDEYRIEIELLRNHPAGHRDLHIDVRDAYDGRLLDEISAYGFSSLAALPLESEDGHFVDDGYGGGYPVDHQGPGAHGAGTLGTEDAYVAGYAAAGGPLLTLVLVAFASLRYRCRSIRQA